MHWGVDGVVDGSAVETLYPVVAVAVRIHDGHSRGENRGGLLGTGGVS